MGICLLTFCDHRSSWRISFPIITEVK